MYVGPWNLKRYGQSLKKLIYVISQDRWVIFFLSNLIFYTPWKKINNNKSPGEYCIAIVPNWENKMNSTYPKK